MEMRSKGVFMNKLPLLVHFVFHPDSNSARELATGLHRSLNHDASVPGLDIPTTFCNYSDRSPPANQGLDRAERSFVVVLADEYLVAGVKAGAWQGFVADIWRDHHSATRTRNNWFGQLRQDIAVPRSTTRIRENRMLLNLNVQSTTPLERMAKHRSLVGRRVAISMSESSDIERYGFCANHLDNGVLELSRYLLIQGAELAYGGHLGEKGYTEQLFDLVRAHNQIDRTESVKPIINYVGWLLPQPDVRKQADFLRVGCFRRVGRPNCLDEKVHSDLVAEPVKFFHADLSPLHRLAWSLGMSRMRQVQTSETCARVVLGGKTDKTVAVQGDGTRTEKWYMSRIPGLLEEVYVSAKAGQPVFLIGAYGGAAAMVIDRIEGKDRAEATWDFQKAAPHAEDLPALYAKFGIEWESYEYIIGFLRAKASPCSTHC